VDQAERCRSGSGRNLTLALDFRVMDDPECGVPPAADSADCYLRRTKLCCATPRSVMKRYIHSDFCLSLSMANFEIFAKIKIYPICSEILLTGIYCGFNVI